MAIRSTNCSGVISAGTATGNPQAERDRALFAKLGLHPERRDTCEDDTQRAERLAQQAQRNAQAERAAALAVDASV